MLLIDVVVEKYVQTGFMRVADVLLAGAPSLQISTHASYKPTLFGLVERMRSTVSPVLLDKESKEV